MGKFISGIHNNSREKYGYWGITGIILWDKVHMHIIPMLGGIKLNKYGKKI